MIDHHYLLSLGFADLYMIRPTYRYRDEELYIWSEGSERRLGPARNGIPRTVVDRQQLEQVLKQFSSDCKK